MLYNDGWIVARSASLGLLLGSETPALSAQGIRSCAVIACDGTTEQA